MAPYSRQGDQAVAFISAPPAMASFSLLQAATLVTYRLNYQKGFARGRPHFDRVLYVRSCVIRAGAGLISFDAAVFLAFRIGRDLRVLR